MSMLAEKKRKQKWLLFPRTNDWMKDTNKFGQKMLEKMGWTPGKGLGAKEQGITQAIRPKVNASQKGLGYKFDPSTVWLEHQGNFSSLLSELNGSNGSNPEKNYQVSSLEEKSKNFKKRVHYHKFARGKDLSRCNLNDLSSIFGGVPHEFTESKELNVETTYQSNETTYLTNMENSKTVVSSVLLENTSEEVTETSSYLSKENEEGNFNRKKKKVKSKSVYFIKEEQINKSLDGLSSNITDVLEVQRCDTFNEDDRNSTSLDVLKPMTRRKNKKRKIQNYEDSVYSNSTLNSDTLQVDSSTCQNEDMLYEAVDLNNSKVLRKRKKLKKKIITEQNSNGYIGDCLLQLYNNDGCESNSDKKYKKRKKLK